MKLLHLTLPLLLLTTACQTNQTASDTAGGVTIYVNPDTGEAVAVDKDGNPSDNPIAQALVDAMRLVQKSPALTEDQIWSTDEDGNRIHLLSGGICPSVWGALKRAEVRTYQADGSNVGCNFENRDTGMVMTFYFYRNGQPLQEEFDETLQLVKNRNPGSKDVTVMSESLGPTANFQYLAKGIEFKTASGASIRSGLWLAEVKGWRLKMRVTYPAETAKATQDFVTVALRGQYDRLDKQFLPQTKIEIEPEDAI